jgi:hypothetical protein
MNIAHIDTICNGGGNLATKSVLSAMQVVTQEARTSEINSGKKKLGNEIEGTLHSNGCSQLTSEVHRPLLSVESPSVCIDSSKCAL